ncbi:MAG: ABC transporter ATP-binding protein [Nocardioides sp.]|uniref:ABC transporter ATP-binding protein n=1 Tax=Nocardioides sp. TaxID=35761 RepID=UPI0039E439F5
MSALAQESEGDVVVLDKLCKRFRGRAGSADIVAIDDTSFRIPRGATVGIVGESGSGKSTLVRCILGLISADSGRAEVLGVNTVGANEQVLRSLRRRAGIVFQEPYEALDPRMRIGDAIAEPLRLHSTLASDQIGDRVGELLEMVLLDPALRTRFPHQLSGGQQQRVNIARALATEPELLVLDEPTSALDVSVRSEVLSLLVRLQNQLGMTYVLVSHDLPTIRAVCSHIIVMYLGRVVEQGTVDQVLGSPSHPYTRFLLGSALSLDPDVKTAPPETRPTVLDGAVDRRGCCFAPRCMEAIPDCSTTVPVLAHRGSPSLVACLRAGE